MRPEFEPFDPALDQVISEIRNEPLDDDVVAAAASRVWARLSQETQPTGHLIQGCADFQALMPDYRAGRLDEARGLLLKDHTHECIACRKALQALAPKVAEFPAPAARKWTPWTSRPSVRWAMAAALAVGVGLTSWNVYLNLPSEARAASTVESVNGLLYRVSNDSAVPVQPGETLPAGAEVRTAKDSGAIVRLDDGSFVEMRERSGFRVSATFRDLTIHLGRGAVIVEAAKQRTGHLYVATKDCKVSVTGTVFGVNSGLKGSRVSVVEGEVRVAQNRQETILRPGDQYTSSPNVVKVAVEDDIAWSTKVDHHIALLKEFSALRKQLEQVRLPDLRYSSRLLDALPAETAVFASIPNLGRTLGEAHEIFRTRVQDSPLLREWYEKQMGEAKGRMNIDEVIGEIRAFSDYLGDEIVLAAPLDVKGGIGAPVFLAEVKRDGLPEFIRAEMTRLGADPSKGHIRFVDSAAAIGEPAKHELVILLKPGIIAASPDVSALRQVASALEGQSHFTGTPFYARLQQAYRDGAGVLFSADLDRIMGAQLRESSGDHARFAMGNIRHMILEQKEVQGQSNTRATFSFAGQRTGIASWLGRPATINALDFVSPEATAVGAFVLRSPATIADELFAMLEKSDPKFREHLNETESKMGVSIRNDLAATLGAEVAFALDGPAFPTPAWKLAVEVYDPARLQAALQRLVQGRFTLTELSANGRTYYRISSEQLRKIGEINYTFADGYMVAAASRALVDQALGFRANGTGIARTAKFTSLIPRDRYENFSGILFHDLGSTLGILADGFASSAPLTPEQRKAIEGLTGDMKPLLVAVYAGDDSVTVATTSSAFSLSAANLLGMKGPAGLTSLFIPHK